MEPRSQALDILSKTPLIDGHNDWPHLIRGFYDNLIENSRFDHESDLVGHVDIKRLLKGRSGAVFWSAYIDSPSKNNDFSIDIHYEVVLHTLQQIDLIHRLVKKYDYALAFAQSADDIFPIFKSGKIACLLGVEGLHQIGNSASVLRMYHRLGVRYITVTHNQNNLYADSATAGSSFHGGLSESGRQMVREMNRVGMLIDLSHASENTAEAVLDVSVAPVAFTHSSTSHYCPSPRNVSDSCLDKLKKNNGIIMISFVPALTHAEPANADISHVVNHIEYVAQKVGYDHIGIGTDFDGMEKSVSGLEDVSKFPDLLASMLSRGICRENIEKVIGLNIIRVLKDVERLSNEELEDLPALEDTIQQLWNDDIRAYVRQVYPDAV